MLKLKPTNIFDFYAPTGNSMKIADFGTPEKEIVKLSNTDSCLNGQEIPEENKNHSIWLYVLGGAVVVAGVFFYLNYKNRQEEDKLK